MPEEITFMEWSTENLNLIVGDSNGNIYVLKFKDNQVYFYFNLGWKIKRKFLKN